MSLWLSLGVAVGLFQAGAQANSAASTAPGVTDLASLIAAARPGDTIRLEPGRYRGPAVVDRPLTILGESGAAVFGNGRGTVLTVAADSVEIRGLIIRGGGRSLDNDDAGVKVERCAGCRITENTVLDGLHGIYLLESRGVAIQRNTVVGDTALAEARRGNGIHLFHTTDSRVGDNVVRETRDGIYFSFADRNEVEGNTVRQVRYGLHYMYSNDNRFANNRFADNAAGAAIMFSARIRFADNLFVHHVGYRAYGILLQTATRIDAVRNRFSGNVVALFMDNSTRNTFRNNTFAGNGIAIDLLSSAENNTFSENVFTENRLAVRMPVGAGENRWADGGRGNYWGDPSVYDLDGDGIGDRPYHVGTPFDVLAGTNPVLQVFSGTPAAAVFSRAESALPLFDLPRVADPAPLMHPPAQLHPSRDTAPSGWPPATITLATLAMLAPVLVLRNARYRALRKGVRS